MGNDNFGFYDQPLFSPFDLRVFASDSDLSAANADHVWISMVDIKARNAIPEPSTVLLISGALLAFGMRKREKR